MQIYLDAKELRYFLMKQLGLDRQSVTPNYSSMEEESLLGVFIHGTNEQLTSILAIIHNKND